MIETTEGIFLATDLNVTLPNVVKELKGINHLMLSDSDYKELSEIKRIRKLSTKIDEKFCKTLKLIIKLFEKDINKHLIIKDDDDQEIVLFNNDGIIYITECTNITTITIQKKNDSMLYKSNSKL